MIMWFNISVIKVSPVDLVIRNRGCHSHIEVSYMFSGIIPNLIIPIVRLCVRVFLCNLCVFMTVSVCQLAKERFISNTVY